MPTLLLAAFVFACGGGGSATDTCTGYAEPMSAEVRAEYLRASDCVRDVTGLQTNHEPMMRLEAGVKCAGSCLDRSDIRGSEYTTCENGGLVGVLVLTEQDAPYGAAHEAIHHVHWFAGEFVDSGHVRPEWGCQS